MITVDEAVLAASGRAPEAKTLPVFSEREQTQLNYLDSAMESLICKSFNGEILETEIPGHLVEPHVIEALKQRYEGGGWKIGLFVRGDGKTVQGYRLVFAPTRKVVVPPKKTDLKSLPPVSSSEAQQATGSRLLIRMPTRGRPVQALEVLEKYRTMAGRPVIVEVIIDEDDEIMLAAEVLQRLAALDCVVTVGNHKSKVEACNGGTVAGWDILMLVSDDMVPVADGYANRVVKAMEEKFPHLDGMIFFNDRFQHGNLCTLPIFGRRLYDQFGYVYAPEYKSLFCDREQTDVLKAAGRLEYIDEVIIEHRHHYWGRAEKDALYERNDAFEDTDKGIYELRKAFGFHAPPLVLSVLICTVPKRKRQLDRLVDDLYRQIIRDARREIEVLIDDRLDVTVGEKRQSLLQRARGKFVAFIDDDDGISWDYVKRIHEAWRVNPDADCLSLEGVMTTRGGRPERFTHSINYDGWFTRDKVHYRTPNHLSPVRRELALEVGFVAKNIGEDFDYSKRLRPLLKKEASTGAAPLYYYFYDPAHSVQT